MPNTLNEFNEFKKKMEIGEPYLEELIKEYGTYTKQYLLYLVGKQLRNEVNTMSYDEIYDRFAKLSPKTLKKLGLKKST